MAFDAAVDSKSHFIMSKSLIIFFRFRIGARVFRLDDFALPVRGCNLVRVLVLSFLSVSLSLPPQRDTTQNEARLLERGACR